MRGIPGQRAEPYLQVSLRIGNTTIDPAQIEGRIISIATPGRDSAWEEVSIMTAALLEERVGEVWVLNPDHRARILTNVTGAPIRPVGLETGMVVHAEHLITAERISDPNNEAKLRDFYANRANNFIEDLRVYLDTHPEQRATIFPIDVDIPYLVDPAHWVYRKIRIEKGEGEALAVVITQVDSQTSTEVPSERFVKYAQDLASGLESLGLGTYGGAIEVRLISSYFAPLKFSPDGQMVLEWGRGEYKGYRDILETVSFSEYYQKTKDVVLPTFFKAVASCSPQTRQQCGVRVAMAMSDLEKSRAMENTEVLGLRKSVARKVAAIYRYGGDVEDILRPIPDDAMPMDSKEVEARRVASSAHSGGAPSPLGTPFGGSVHANPHVLRSALNLRGSGSFDTQRGLVGRGGGAASAPPSRPGAASPPVIASERPGAPAPGEGDAAFVRTSGIQATRDVEQVLRDAEFARRLAESDRREAAARMAEQRAREAEAAAQEATRKAEESRKREAEVEARRLAQARDAAIAEERARQAAEAERRQAEEARNVQQRAREMAAAAQEAARKEEELRKREAEVEARRREQLQKDEELARKIDEWERHQAEEARNAERRAQEVAAAAQEAARKAEELRKREAEVAAREAQVRRDAEIARSLAAEQEAEAQRPAPAPAPVSAIPTSTRPFTAPALGAIRDVFARRQLVIAPRDSNKEERKLTLTTAQILAINDPGANMEEILTSIVAARVSKIRYYEPKDPSQQGVVKADAMRAANKIEAEIKRSGVKCDKVDKGSYLEFNCGQLSAALTRSAALSGAAAVR